MPTKILGVALDAPRGWAPRPWKRIEPAALTRPRMAAESPVVLVLGDRALEVLEPGDVVAALRGVRARVVLAPERVAYERFAAWTRATAFEVVARDCLADRLRLIVSRPLRVALAPEDWLGGDAADPFARQIAEVLATLDVPRPASLAAALGVKARRLSERTGARLGTTPRELCRRHAAAVHARERADAVPCAKIAAGLGYADAATLLRGLRDAGRRSGAKRRS